MPTTPRKFRNQMLYVISVLVRRFSGQKRLVQVDEEELVCHINVEYVLDFY